MKLVTGVNHNIVCSSLLVSSLPIFYIHVEHRAADLQPYRVFERFSLLSVTAVVAQASYINFC